MDEKAAIKSSSVPRATTMTGTGRWGIAIPVILCVVAVLFASILGLADYHRALALRERGVWTTGKIVRLYITKQKATTAYHAGYVFSPKQLSGAYNPSVSNEGIVSSADYSDLYVGKIVSVVYDPVRPDRSILNYHDAIHRLNPSEIAKDFAMAVTAIILIFVIPVVIIVAVYLRQKHLLQWGTAAAATIIGEREYRVKYGYQAALTYQFRDAQGNHFQDVRRGIPTKSDSRSDFLEYRARFVDNPLVLFDPKNSIRNALYPLSLVRPRAD